MSTRVSHHRIVSATLQTKHYSTFSTLELVTLDSDGQTLMVELFTDGNTPLMPQWITPTFAKDAIPVGETA